MNTLFNFSNALKFSLLTFKLIRYCVKIALKITYNLIEISKSHNKRDARLDEH